MRKRFSGNIVPVLAFTIALWQPPAFAVDRDEAVASFQIHPDFQIELVAAEPEILDPVDLEFDEFGRMFVVEMPGYPFPDRPGRIILLADENGDGYYESRHVFADGLAVADSALPYQGGLLVASPPDLLFLKDTDGDNAADLREVLVTGFAVGNPQHNFNGLNHGLDNWIYGSNGGNSGSVYWPDAPDDRVPLRGEEFRIDLRTNRFERAGRSAGGFEATFDEWGRYFDTHNLYHIRQLVFPGRYIEGLPVPRLGSLGEVSDHEENGLARIFPIGPQATRVNHPEQSGYFSGSCGITFYGGGSFPEEFNGNVFVADVVLNLIHRDVISPDGGAMKASRGRERVEFLASTDRGFRPVNMTVGPDGALYVLDMHRVVIEHPEWIPDELEAEMDLDAGKDQGRIYRITPKGGLPWVAPGFGRDKLAETVGHLGHKNKWWRDTAQRLLVEWGDAAAVPLLERALRESDNPLARLHALWTLEGLGALENPDAALALNDPHPGVRENALRVAEPRLGADSALLGRALEMLDDETPRVRMQAALTLGAAHEAAGEGLGAGLGAMAARGDLSDPWIRMAILSAAQHDPLALMDDLLAQPRISGRVETASLLNQLGAVLGRTGPSPELRDLLAGLAENEQAPPRALAAILDGFAEGFERRSAEPLRDEEYGAVAVSVERLGAHDSLAVVRAAWRAGAALDLPPSARQRELFATAGERVMNAQADTAARLDELALLMFAPFEDRVDTLFELLGTGHPADLQAAAIAQLSEDGDTKVAARLIESWDALGPATLREAGNFLLFRRENQAALLTALENGVVALGQLNLDLERRRRLLRSREPGVKERAEALFNDAGVVTRKEALQAMRPALSLTGDAAKGQAVFAELCGICHRLGGEGTDFGPNLTDIFRKSAETLLHDIVDPNAAVAAEFVSFSIETVNGEFRSGLIVAETDLAVTLREAEGHEMAFEKDQIEEMYSSGLSLMPEGLESGMEPQTMADLLAFLQEPR